MNKLDALKRCKQRTERIRNSYTSDGKPEPGYEDAWEEVSEELAVLRELIKIWEESPILTDNPKEQAAPEQQPERQGQIDMLDLRVRAAIGHAALVRAIERFGIPKSVSDVMKEHSY